MSTTGTDTGNEITDERALIHLLRETLDITLVALEEVSGYLRAESAQRMALQRRTPREPSPLHKEVLRVLHLGDDAMCETNPARLKNTDDKETT